MLRKVRYWPAKLNVSESSSAAELRTATVGHPSRCHHSSTPAHSACSRGQDRSTIPPGTGMPARTSSARKKALPPTERFQNVRSCSMGVSSRLSQTIGLDIAVGSLSPETTLFIQIRPAPVVTHLL